MIRTLTAAILLCGGLAWGGNVAGIEVSVTTQSGNCPCVSAISDGGGAVGFSIAAAGSYIVKATQNISTGGPLYGVELTGLFKVVGTGAAGGKLIAAGPIGAGPGTIFSANVNVSGPVRFSGQFYSDGDVATSTDHLTFHAILGGAQPLAKNLYILNNSASSVGYTASVQTIGNAWTVNLSGATGTADVGGSGVISVQPVVPAKAGTYSALLNISEQETGNAIAHQTVGVTLVVSAPGYTNATIGLDQIMAASALQSNGKPAPATYTVSNQDATSQTYTVTVDSSTGSSSDASIQPAQFMLAPGASQAVQVQANSAKSLMFDIIASSGGASSGATANVFDVVPAGPYGPAGPAGVCAPTQLLPVAPQVDTTARSGYPINMAVQVFDNCGNAYPEFTASVSLGNSASGPQLLTVEASAGRAVTTKGIDGKPLAVFHVPCSFQSPYSSTEGMTLTIAVDAPNPEGGSDLLGSIAIPVNYEFDATAPILGVGGLVSGASFEPRAVSPLEIFSVFGTFPGLATGSAAGSPWLPALNGFQIAFDGEPAPVYFTSSGQVNGVVPADMTPGPHEAIAFLNGILSGSMTIMVAAANPAAFTSDGVTPFMVKTDGSIVSPSNPAKVGDVLVMYMDGLGLSTVAVQSGFPTPSEQAPAQLQPVSVLINGEAQQVGYAGLTPNSISLYQINFTVGSIPAPAGGGSGPAGLAITFTQGNITGSPVALGSFTTNPTTQSIATISVQANYPDAQFNVNNQLITGSTGVLTFTAGTQVPFNVPPDPQMPSAGTRYYFYGWSQGGSRSQTLTVPAGGTAFEAYFLASYLLTVNGSSTQSPTSSDGYYEQTPNIFIPVKVTGSCPGGATVLGLLVSTASGSVTVPNGSTVTMNAPTTVTVQCSAPASLSTCVAPPSGMISWYSLDEAVSPSKDIAAGGGGANATWVGNPTPVAGKVAGALSFNGSSQYLQAVNATEGDIAKGDMSADAWIKTTSMQVQSIVSKGYGEPFSAFYQGYRLGTYLGDLYFAYGSGSAGTYYFSTAFVGDGNWHHVAVTVSRSSTSGGTLYVDGVSVLVFDPTLNPGTWSNSEPLTIGRDQGSFLYNGIVVALNGAIDEVEVFNRALSAAEVGGIYAAGSFGKCKGPADTVTTIPPNLKVTIDSASQVTAPQTVTWAAGSNHALGAPSPQYDLAGDTQYTLSTTTPWTATVGSITSGGMVASAPATSSTYTANFNTAYQVTLALGNCFVGNTTLPGITGSGSVFVAANSFVNVAIGANAPNVFQSASATPSTNVTISSSSVTINPLTGPVTITANCTTPANVTLTVDTSPVEGLSASINSSAYAPAPISAQVTPNTTQTISVTTPQYAASTGIGYSFNNWSTGGATATSTVQPSANFTATANFKVACYALTVNVTPAGSGIVAVNPPSGGLAGLPSNCYAPGAVVTLTASGGNGNTLQGWTGITGTANPASVTINGATTVTATFGPPPNVVFGLSSRTGGNLSMYVSNTGATTATNVMIDSITNITPSTVAYDPAFFTLPVAVPGGASVPTGAQNGFNLLFEVNGSTSFTTSFSFTITAHAANEPSFTQTITAP